MKLTLIIPALLLTGCCTTTKLVMPEASESLLKDCPELERVADTATLTEFTNSVVSNYTTYHTCREQHRSFIEWYKIQKEIVEKK